MRHLLAFVLAFVSLTACGSEPAAPPPTIGCLAGTVATCTCIGAGDGEGSRTCGPTGRYGLCVCPGSDAGDDDASSADVPEGDADAGEFDAGGDGPGLDASSDGATSTDALPVDTGVFDTMSGCNPFEVRCGVRCINHFTDPRNCGRCGAICPPGNACANASCIEPDASADAE